MNCCRFICKTLSDTIKETKRSYYNTKITTSENEIKMAWNVVKSIEIGGQYEESETFKNDGKCIKDCQIISDSVIDCFVSQAM
jgi:hypothetical protein